MLNSAQSAAIESLQSLQAPLAAQTFWPSVEDGLAIAFLCVLAGCMILEKRRPLRPAAKAAAKASYKFNLITFLLNNLGLSLLSLPALYVVAESFSGYGLLSDWHAGIPKFVVCLLLMDLTMYGWHYFMHHCDALWTFHRFHHSDASLNVTSGLRFHTGELVLEVLVRCGFIVAMGVDSATALICQGIISVFVLLHHANVRFPGEAWLSYLFVMPGMHRVHHSVLRSEHDSNYGEIFSVWDRLFGTTKNVEPAAIGLPPDEDPGLIQIVWESVQSWTAPTRQLIPSRIPRETPERR